MHRKEIMQLPLFLDGSEGSLWPLGEASAREWEEILASPGGLVARYRYVPASAVVALLVAKGLLQLSAGGSVGSGVAPSQM